MSARYTVPPTTGVPAGFSTTPGGSRSLFKSENNVGLCSADWTGGLCQIAFRLDHDRRWARPLLRNIPNCPFVPWLWRPVSHCGLCGNDPMRPSVMVNSSIGFLVSAACHVHVPFPPLCLLLCSLRLYGGQEFLWRPYAIEARRVLRGVGVGEGERGGIGQD